MRRSDLSHVTDLATLPTALAVAMAVLSVATAITHLASQFHGVIDGAAIVSSVYAMRKHELRHGGGHSRAADVMARAVGKSLRAENDKDGERVRRCS
jgi:hypothetical protein